MTYILSTINMSNKPKKTKKHEYMANSFPQSLHLQFTLSQKDKLITIIHLTKIWITIHVCVLLWAGYKLNHFWCFFFSVWGWSSVKKTIPPKVFISSDRLSIIYGQCANNEQLGKDGGTERNRTTGRCSLNKHYTLYRVMQKLKPFLFLSNQVHQEEAIRIDFSKSNVSLASKTGDSVNLTHWRIDKTC